MWTAKEWNEYELIDASDGERLERWGEYILIRPDPQVIWSTGKNDVRWNKWNGYYHRSVKGGGEWEIRKLPKQWSIRYKEELKFNLKPFNFKHTGIFPEQAVNWDWVTELIKKAKEKNKKEIRILNLFAYTGGATIAASMAGAHVVHVDAAKGMVSWAKENTDLSGLSQNPIRYIVDDCQKFIEREIRRGSVYDGVIMDPPSYGRGPKGEVWKMEDNIYSLIKMCAKILNKNPLFFLINSYTTGLQPAVLTYLIELEICKVYGGCVTSDEIGLPVTSSGLYLPCGASGRWESLKATE